MAIRSCPRPPKLGDWGQAVPESFLQLKTRPIARCNLTLFPQLAVGGSQPIERRLAHHLVAHHSGEARLPSFPGGDGAVTAVGNYAPGGTVESVAVAVNWWCLLSIGQLLSAAIQSS
jgi:hypothetical protein